MLDLGEKMVRIVCPTRALIYPQRGRKPKPQELAKTKADPKLGSARSAGSRPARNSLTSQY